MKFRLLLVLIVVSLAFSAQADASYISIQEMQNDVPATWTETLTGGKDIACTIDAVIAVPDVDRFPILQATWQGEIEGLDQNLVIEENSERHVFVKTLPDNVTDTWQKGVKTETLVTCEDEMDPKTVRQADEKAEKMLREICDMDGISLERLGVQVHTIVRLDSREFVQESVVANYCPTYSGIAVLNRPFPLCVLKNYTSAPVGYAYAFWRTDIDYWGVNIMIPRVTGETEPDVPLMSFQEIQEIILEHIQQGYIQSIDEIRLGYIVVNNSENPDQSFYLTPAWVVCGVMNAQPNLPFHPEGHWDTTQRYSGSQFVINAQTGEWMDPNSRNVSTFYEHILTWKDVQ